MNIEATSGAGSSPVAVVPTVVARPQQADEDKRLARPVEQPREPARDEQKKKSDDEVKEAAARINEFVESMTTDIQFSVDKETNRTVVKVLSRKNGEVIRQIPSEEVLKIAKVLDELEGLIIREKV